MSEKSGVQRILKAGVAYTIGNFLVKGLSFLSIPIFVRLLSVAEYGQYNTYLAYEGIMANIIGLALQISIKNAKFKYEEKYHDYISSVLMLEIISTIGWIIVVIVAFPLISNYTSLDEFSLILLVLHCFANTMLAFYNIYLSMDYAYKSYLIVGLINAFLNITFSVVLISTVFSENGYLGRVVGTVLPVLLIAIAIIFFFFSKARPSFSISYWKFGLVFSLPLIPHAISQVVLNSFDRIMITDMIGAEAAGIYSFAYNIYLVINVTANSLDNVWCPWFFGEYKKGNFAGIKSRSSVYSVGMLLFVSLVMLASPEIIRILGTDRYKESIYSVIPVCAGGFFCFLYSIPVQVEYYLEKTKYIPIGTIIAALTNIVLNYFFINRFGYIAAAYTTEFTYLLYFLAQYLIARKIAGRQLFDNKTMILVSFANIAISIIALYLIDYFIIRWLIIVIILSILAISFRKYKSLLKRGC